MLRARKLASAALTVSLVTAAGIGTAVLSAGTAHAADACPTASQIVTDINVIASAAGGLSAKSGALTPSSIPGDVQSAAQSTAAGLNTMINDFSADTAVLGGCPEPDSADSQAVADAFRSLTSATQQMLSTLTSKHSIFAQFGVTAPLASSLRALEAALDSYTYALIAANPSQQSALTNGKDSVDSSVGNAITLFGQLCIPSPLYPAVPPVCAAL
jgi:hypothetical protein